MALDRLRVFVSSSVAELASEREAVDEALKQLGVDAWRFEAEVGASRVIFRDAYLEGLRGADLAISLFWLKYGEYTADEFDEARRLAIPQLVYLKQVNQEERDPQLNDFLSKIGSVESGLAFGSFVTPDELRAMVQRDVARLLARSFREAVEVRDPDYKTTQVDDVGSSDVLALRGSVRLRAEEPPLESWDAIVALLQERRGEWGGWVFRGQADSQWGLSTALERTAKRWDVWDQLPEIEDELLDRFQRQLHHYQPTVPDNQSRIEWLALMQHHGAPTRLLDWTYSFYVALLFALERAETEGTCAVWALDAGWWRNLAVYSLDSGVQEALGDDPAARKPATIDRILFRDDPKPLIFPINPFRLNERLVLQQGIFLAPGDLQQTFERNMLECADGANQTPRYEKILIECNMKLLKDSRQELHRMNVTRATLFPGLDGFAAHLANLAGDLELMAMDVLGQ